MDKEACRATEADADSQSGMIVVICHTKSGFRVGRNAQHLFQVGSNELGVHATRSLLRGMSGSSSAGRAHAMPLVSWSGTD